MIRLGDHMVMEEEELIAHFLNGRNNTCIRWVRHYSHWTEGIDSFENISLAPPQSSLDLTHKTIHEPRDNNSL